MKNKIDIFLDEITKSLGSLKTKEFWPLNPGQIYSYFDADFAIDFYNRFYYLRGKGHDQHQIARKFHNAYQLRDFLLNFVCIGIKVANNFNFLKTSKEEREDFILEILEIIEILEENETKEKMSADFQMISEKEKNIINKLKVALFGLNWSFHYDVMAGYGENIKTPIKIKYKNKNYILLNHQYYNQKQINIWPVSKKNKFNTVKILALYKPFKFSTNYFGRIKTQDNIGRKLVGINLKIDNKIINRISKLEKTLFEIFAVSAEQTEYVNNLVDLKKVDKAILMTYDYYKDFFGKDWKALYNKTKKNLEIFGDKFIRENQISSADRTKAEIRKMFDPRNNYLGDI